MDQQKVSILILLDLSAAFDTFNHQKLINIFHNRFNITNTALAWLKSYITGRHQVVKINSELSNKFNLQHGVPQGSCIGPIAFLAYISSLYDILENYLPCVEGYADDHQLYIALKPNSLKSIQQSVTEIETCVSAIRNFMLINQLKINDNKTEIVIIGSRQQLSKLPDIHIKIGSINVQPIDTVTNLGVTLDSKMTMNNHINRVCRNANYQLIKIRQLRQYLTKHSTETIVHAFITSTSDHCNSIYCMQPIK